MQINVDIDSLQLILRLQKGERRLAFAVVKAINATAKHVQQAEFEHIERTFRIRRPTFFFGTPARPGGTAARIRPFASVKQGRPYAEIAISPPAGRGLISRRLLLPALEAGGMRTPFTPGAQRVAIPVTFGPARPSFQSEIPKEFTFSGMRLVAYRAGKRVQRANKRSGRRDETLYGTEGRAKLPERSGTQWKGRNRTFTVLGTQPSHPGGVFQRTGPRREDKRPVYLFRPPMQLRSRLRWMMTARRAAGLWFKEEMEKEAVQAVAHARGVLQ